MSFNFGRLPGRPSVMSQVVDALPWTLAMFSLGLGAAFVVGTRVGVIALIVRLIVDVVHLALDPRVTAEAA